MQSSLKRDEEKIEKAAISKKGEGIPKGGGEGTRALEKTFEYRGGRWWPSWIRDLILKESGREERATKKKG